LRISSILKVGNVRVLTYLLENGEARYRDLLNDVISVRSTLAIVLNELLEEELIERRVKPTKPVQTLYSLTELGAKIARYLKAIEDALLRGEAVRASGRGEAGRTATPSPAQK